MAAESTLQRQPTLAELVDPEPFREVVQSLADLYGVGVRVFDAEGTKVVDVRVGPGDLCSALFRYPAARRACTDLVGRLKGRALLEGAASGEPLFVDCHTGLRYAVLPLSYEGDHMGRLILGPYWPRERRAELDGRVRELAPEADFDRLGESARAIRSLSERAVRRMLAQMGTVIDVIVHTSYRAKLTSSMHVESITASYKELLEKNRELAEANERLKELDRLKSNFLAMVSHELRTPLTSIIGYAEMLLEGMAGELNPEQREYVATVMEKGEALLQMISSLLEIARVESKQLKLVRSEVSLQEVAAAAARSVIPAITRKRIHFAQSVADGLPTLRADRDKIRQVLVNLLQNAVKFTPDEGRIGLEIDLCEGERRDAEPLERRSVFDEVPQRFVRIRVTDTGIGIPREHHERIFESFYQVDSSSTREYGGSGLGLAIVRSFVEAHGGQVWVESSPGEGSRFTVLLPVDDEGAR